MDVDTCVHVSVDVDTCVHISVDVDTCAHVSGRRRSDDVGQRIIATLPVRAGGGLSLSLTLGF